MMLHFAGGPSGRDLPGLPDMSRCQNNACNKNQKLKSYHNAVLHTAPESGPDLPAFPAGTTGRTTDVGPLETGFTANGVYSNC